MGSVGLCLVWALFVSAASDHFSLAQAGSASVCLVAHAPPAPSCCTSTEIGSSRSIGSWESRWTAVAVNRLDAAWVAVWWVDLRPNKGWFIGKLTSVAQACPIACRVVILVHLKIPIEEMFTIALGVPCLNLSSVPVCSHL
jgi:hypothetical protein